MNNLKAVLLASTITKILFCVCVTVAAIHFNNAAILWWYLLSIFFGYEYKTGGRYND